MQLADLQPHADPERRVEVREGFVEQKGRGFAHDRAADGDPLALAARELARPPIEVLGQVQHRGGLLDPPVLLGLVHLRHPQGKADVLADRHVRIERVGLEHHRQAALGGRDGGRVLAVDLGSCRRSRRPPAPRSAAISVDLPQPEGPTKTTNSPSSISRSRGGMTVDVTEALCHVVECNASHILVLTSPRRRSGRGRAVSG